MNVSAIIVTRGGQDLNPVVAALPREWETLIWDNGGNLWRNGPNENHVEREANVPDLGAYGRYAAIEHARNDLIYVQDDDCIASDPQAIVETYQFIATCPEHGPMQYGQVKGHYGWVCWNDEHQVAPFSPDAVVCNMPPSRTDYTDTVLIGWGAVFHRDAPERAFSRWREAGHSTETRDFQVIGADFVFPMLTPHIRIDAEHEDLPWAHAPNRTWSQPGYAEKKQWFLNRAREIRDGG